MRWILPLMLGLVLAGCGQDERQAGGVTRAQADALDEAAARLEASRVPVVAETAGAEPQPTG